MKRTLISREMQKMGKEDKRTNKKGGKQSSFIKTEKSLLS